MVKDICGNWVGIQSECCDVGMKASWLMPIGFMVNFFGCG
jgi:hypothetical protein